ncbi:unnamed protein product [Withania somnifera]
MAFFNTLTLTLSFFCFLLFSYGSSTSIHPPSSSAHAAANTLRNRGYSLFASTIDSTNTNFSGTIFAPPDFIFTTKILNNHPSSSPPRPSSILLRYHTLNTPLTWINLLSNVLVNNAGIPTLYNNNCLFFFKSSIGDISISSTNRSSVRGVVNIKQPDIYVDDHLTVHGIDGVLDPTLAMKCSQVQIQSHQHHRSFLDHAIRALRRRRRFTVAAVGLAIKRQELLSLTSVTLFAPSDMAFFSNPDGFRYDYRHHVVPERFRFGDLAKGTSMVLETLAPNKTLVVDLIDGVVTVNGVIVNRTEVYRNRWIVVLSVSMSLDDAGNLVDSGSFAPSPAPETMELPYPDDRTNGFNAGVQSPWPAEMELHHSDEKINGYTTTVQLPESPSPATMGIRYPDERINGYNGSVESPSPAAGTMKSEVNDSPCVFDIPAGMEGGDLLCPASGSRNRNLQEKEDLIEGHVASYAQFDVKDQVGEDVNQSQPLISSVKEDHNRMNSIDQNQQDQLNIANDLFFYF